MIHLAHWMKRKKNLSKSKKPASKAKIRISSKTIPFIPINQCCSVASVVKRLMTQPKCTVVCNDQKPCPHRLYHLASLVLAKPLNWASGKCCWISNQLCGSVDCIEQFDFFRVPYLLEINLFISVGFIWFQWFLFFFCTSFVGVILSLSIFFYHFAFYFPSFYVHTPVYM